MPPPLRVLILADRPADAALWLGELQRSGLAVEPCVAASAGDFVSCLQEPFDVILADYAGEKLDAARALQICREQGAEMPLIVIGGAVGEEAAVACVKQGAADFLRKENLARLGQAVAAALRQRQGKRERRDADMTLSKSREILARVQSIGGIGYWELDLRTNQAIWSDELYRIFGYQPGQIAPSYQAYLERVHPDERAMVMQTVGKALQTGQPLLMEHRIIQPNGAVRVINGQGVIEADADGKPAMFVGITRDITHRVETEQMLRTTQTRLEYLLLASSAIIYSCRVPASAPPGSFEVTFMSANVTAQLGYEARQFIESPHFWIEQIHPDDLATVIQSQPALFANGQQIVEYRLRRKDGVYRWIRDEVKLTRRAGGESHEIAGFLLDITAKKQAEEALHRSEERYRSLFEHTPVAIWDEDCTRTKAFVDGLERPADGDLDAYLLHHPELVAAAGALVKVTDVNQATLALHHASSKDELLGNITQTFTPESYEAFRKLLVASWRGDRHVVLDATVQTLDGQRRDISLHWSVCPGSEQTHEHILLSMVDITQRRRAEEALRQSERNFKTLVENSPDIIARFDRNLRHLFINRAIGRATGLPPSHFLGKTNRELGMPAELCDLWDVRIREALTENRPVELEFAVPSPQGQWRYYHSRLVPELASDGTVESILSIVQDITPRRQAQEALRRSEEHYRQVAQTNRRLLQEVNHRVRNNLASLLSLITLTRRKVSDVTAFAAALEKRIDTMARIHNLLADAGWGDLDLRTLLTNLLASIQRTASHLIPVDIEGPPIPISPRQSLPLAMSLLELFVNSSKHGSHSCATGHISITWEKRTTPQGDAVRLLWNESGGPPIQASVTPGLGMELIEGFVEFELGGRCTLNFKPQGADHAIEFPVEKTPPA